MSKPFPAPQALAVALAGAAAVSLSAVGLGQEAPIEPVAGQALNAGSSIGGGFAVNLESIPLDAVERVEILTDGASALYGSDAVAGVINFILRKNSTAGSVFFNWNAVQHAGGDSWSAG